jgi:hypothetical protein
LTIVSKSTDGTLNISWKTPASNGGLPITGYVVFWRLEDGNKLTTMPKVTVLERTITGLKPGARYRVSVAAVNKAYPGRACMAPLLDLLMTLLHLGAGGWRGGGAEHTGILRLRIEKG